MSGEVPRYSEKVIKYFLNPVNVGEIPDADAKATEGSVACGDMVTIWLKVDPKTHKITDIKFKSYGCASNIATASILTEMVKGKTIEEAKKIKFKDVTEALGGLPPIKLHCAVLAVNALRSAIQNYEERHGLVKELKVDDSLIRRRLRKIMHPWYGKDIITLGMVKDFEIKGNTIVVKIAFIKENDPFKSHIIEEIEEKLGSLPEYTLKIEIVPFTVDMVR
ncbi:MAG: iron-sulfur cluster assembly scaffold protein [Candidatus Asgardarchaeia archaeon]